MKERGMIFNDEMVRAIIDGRKTQTRRIVKPQPELTERSGFSWNGALYGAGSDSRETNRNFAHTKCPFGKPGDRIWVRETFTGHYLDDAQIQDIKDGREKASDLCEYRADYPDGYQAADGWTPSIHMPRWASRILLEITDVRVERLNAINEHDAQAEGVAKLRGGFWKHYQPGWTQHQLSARGSFVTLWKSIYGDESWNSNPWVWVIKFKRIEDLTA